MAKIDCQHIRNFSIVAHIDHGKSTLADRLLEKTGTVTEARDARADARRHGPGAAAGHHDQGPRRGHALHATTAKTYELNLIDTPGHVDFQYEVSRSLACCEGAVLLVDAFQGVEAQTVANAYAAMEHDLTIVPVLNKIDLKHARPDEVHRRDGVGAGDRSRRGAAMQRQDRRRRRRAAGRRSSSACRRRRATRDAPLQAMVFDSQYDEYRGAITYVRVMNGTVRKGQKIRFLQGRHRRTRCSSWASSCRSAAPCDELQAGQVGYVICNIKTLGQVHVGDTVTVPGDEAAEPLPGYQPAAADGLLRALSVRRPGFRGTARRADQAARSTTPASSSSPRRATPWASASAAASSACCTWRSSSSGWRAKPTSTWCRPRRT